MEKRKRKKRVVFHSDSAIAKTGFGRNSKALLKYLHGTNKYDITHYCCSLTENDPSHKLTPWKSIGCLPSNQAELQMINADQAKARKASYGEYYIDKTIQDVKPDVYIGVQDIWGVDFCIDRPWFKKINSVVWTTLDSLPILPMAVEKAKDIENYWIWSNFATKALHKLGHKHVETVHGCVETKHFKKLDKKARLKLRKKNNIEENAFITGFVFRNQLRKTVDKLIEGYKIWKDKEKPEVPTYLLLHTSFSEGWNILKIAERIGVDPKEILTTYVCKHCREYEVKPFVGQDVECKHCGSKDGYTTTGVRFGVSEKELNEVYNLMDFYCHPFTSGGQEIPIQEAKLTELITAVTNYSCGEEMCEPEAWSIPLDWDDSLETSTEFIKATTKASSIADAFQIVYSGLGDETKSETGKAARQWVLDNFSVRVIGEKLEKFIDGCDYVEGYDFDFTPAEKDPMAKIEQIDSDKDWVKQLYKKILKTEVDDKDSGLHHWVERLGKDLKRENVESYFRNIAASDNQKNHKTSFDDILDKDDRDRRILYVIPESIGDVFLATSVIDSLKRVYPKYNIYVGTKPQHFEILENNPNIHKIIPYIPEMDNQMLMEGAGKNKGFFELSFHGYLAIQRFLDYLHQGNKDIIELDV